MNKFLATLLTTAFATDAAKPVGAAIVTATKGEKPSKAQTAA